MGRPPIGKIAMTSTERSRRYRAGLATKPTATKPAKPATKPAGREGEARLQRELAAARGRIAELEAQLARRAAAEASIDGEEAAGAGPMGRKVFKILLKLADADDNTVLVAARKLVGDLKASGSDLRTLADAMGAEWEKQQKAKPAPRPPIDWSEVEAAVTKYAADRATVNFNRLSKALDAEVPALRGNREQDQNYESTRYIIACLHRLGFTGSGSGLTWQRH
jgi:hypothetical protein